MSIKYSVKRTFLVCMLLLITAIFGNEHWAINETDTNPNNKKIARKHSASYTDLFPSYLNRLSMFQFFNTIDTDGDGVIDVDDLDDDNDGILDVEEDGFDPQGSAYAIENIYFVGEIDVNVLGQPVRVDRPTGFTFNDDGTRMYVINFNTTLYEYTLSRPFDVTTGVATGASVNLDLDSANDLTYNVQFSADGSKLFVIDDNSNTDGIKQYNLSTPWNINTVSLEASLSLDTIAPTDNNPRGFDFSSDCTILFLWGQRTSTIYRVPLTTPYDIRTANYVAGSNFTIPSSPVEPYGFTFSANGLILFIQHADANDVVAAYELTSPYAIHTASSTPTVQASLDNTVRGRDVQFSPDGRYYYVVDEADDKVQVYALFTDFDLDEMRNSADLDSDDDGISDLIEGGSDPSVLDPDGNGIIDGAVFTDGNSNGVHDALEGGVTPPDSDGDGDFDYKDIDADNDGILDTFEADPSNAYLDPSDSDTQVDDDGDGVQSVFDNSPPDGFGGAFNVPEDTDGDGTPDYIDTDSDNDTVLDIDESGFTGTDTSDSDEDGLQDRFDNVNGNIGTPGTFDSSDGHNVNTVLLDTNGNGEFDFRETTSATDLYVSKISSVAGSFPDEGDAFNYTITVENRGPEDATNISLTDVLPAGLTYVNSLPSIGTYNNGTGLWTIGNLINGASATLTINVTIDAGQMGNTIVNTITNVSLDQTDNNATADDLTENITVAEVCVLNGNERDFDGDGIFDYVDLDDDNDGILGDTLNNLLPNLKYDVYVRANCYDLSTFSEWVGPKSFTTKSLSIAPIHKNYHNIYPNPVKDIMHITSQQPTTLQLYNLQGQLLKSIETQQNTTVSLIGLASGVYYLKDINNGTSVKVIKK